MRHTPRKSRALLGLGVAALVAGSFYAGSVWAADSRLDLAAAHIEKATALVKAAKNPNADPPFGGHDRRAIRNLEQALAEIQLAKAFADDPKNHRIKTPR